MEILKEKNLNQIRETVSFSADAEFTYENLKKFLPQKFEEENIPCKIESAEISKGLLSANEPCIILYHPDHFYVYGNDDYFYFCIYIQNASRHTYATVYSYGKSTQMKHADVAGEKIFNGAGARGTAVGAFTGGALGAGLAVGSILGSAVSGGARAISKGFNSLMLDKEKLSLEQEWYDDVLTVLDNLMA